MKPAALLPLLILTLLPRGTMAQSPPDEGLVLRYSSTSPGQDLSGKNNTGLWNNIDLASGIPGISDSSFYFDGSESYIEAPPALSIDHCKSMTFSVWCNLDALPPMNGWMHLASRRFPTTHPFMGLFFSSMLVTFCQTNGDKTVWLTLPEPAFLQKNTWYHVAGVFDGDKHEMRLYLNGELKSTSPADIDLATPHEVPLHIGCDMRDNSLREKLFKGRMEDIRFYERALNDEDVRTLTRGYVFPKPENAFEKIERLDAGRYIFSKVDSSGQGVEPWEVVEISALEPLWKKGWFVACCIAATFLLTLLLVQWYDRLRRQEQAFEFEKRQMLERERFRIAREMHDDIGSGLSAINLLTEIALNKSKDPQLAAEIGRIAAAAREVHTRIQDIIWAISAQNDTLAGLLQHLQRFAADLLAPTGIVLHYDAPTDLPVLIISGERRRALFLAFKEALHNIVKHARATWVGIDISLSGKQLSVCIQDNGRGFDPETVNDSGNGLLNMRRRLEEAGGRFSVESGGNGTAVTFVLPL